VRALASCGSVRAPGRAPAPGPSDDAQRAMQEGIETLERRIDAAVAAHDYLLCAELDGQLQKLRAFRAGGHCPVTASAPPDRRPPPAASARSPRAPGAGGSRRPRSPDAPRRPQPTHSWLGRTSSALGRYAPKLDSPARTGPDGVLARSRKTGARQGGQRSYVSRVGRRTQKRWHGALPVSADVAAERVPFRFRRRLAASQRHVAHADGPRASRRGRPDGHKRGSVRGGLRDAGAAGGDRAPRRAHGDRGRRSVRDGRAQNGRPRPRGKRRKRGAVRVHRGAAAARYEKLQRSLSRQLRLRAAARG
jgi:hypothetical protein